MLQCIAGSPLILAIGRVGRRAFPREGRVSVMSPGARNRMAREDFLGSASTQAPRDRSTVEHELALRPGFCTRVRMPPTARSAPRGGRRGAGFDCGAGAVLLPGVTPPLRWSRPYLIERADVLRFLPRGPTERRSDGNAQETVPQTEANLAARKRSVAQHNGQFSGLTRRPANDYRAQDRAGAWTVAATRSGSATAPLHLHGYGQDLQVINQAKVHQLQALSATSRRSPMKRCLSQMWQETDHGALQAINRGKVHQLQALSATTGDLR